MSDDFLALNGIDAVTGDYLLKLTEADIVKIAKGEEWDVNQNPLLYALNSRIANDDDHFGVTGGLMRLIWLRRDGELFLPITKILLS